MNAANLPSHLPRLQLEFRRELIAIADWWLENTIDNEKGGFYGEVSTDNKPVKNANKGIILNSRILWFFSEVALEIDNPEYRKAANRAYDFIVDFFFDETYGGVYWELDANGVAINTKKQVYAQAFTIYALVAYYKLTRDENALSSALHCFELLESKAIDCKQEGYFEAFTRSWNKLDDFRLSEKDLNFPKSQNTHLHILEAYTTLNNIYPNSGVRAALRYNIELFDKYIIDKNTFHLRMFMDKGWKDFSPGYTYGHDIEASWLIAKGLESLNDEDLTLSLTPTLIEIAKTILREGKGAYGQIIDSYNFDTKTKVQDSVWWVQAEALVGFLFAHSETQDVEFLAAAENIWAFIKKYQIDHKNGEWFWSSTIDKPPQDPFYKVGFWKCPYHNGRAMIEATRYLNKTI